MKRNKSDWQAAIIRNHLSQSAAVKQDVMEKCQSDIQSAGDVLVGAFQAGGKLLLCGNGGSAADSQHIATELVVRMGQERPGIQAIALTTDTSLMTAMTNDYSFDRVFSRQIETLGQPNDVVLGISTSGNSPNVISAAKTARDKGMKVIVFTGKTGGALKDLSDVVIQVPSDDTQHIQEAHITIGHILCAIIEQSLYPEYFE